MHVQYHTDAQFYPRDMTHQDKFEDLIAKAKNALREGDDNEFNRMIELAKNVPV